MLSKYLFSVLVWLLCSGYSVCTYVPRSVISHSILIWTHIISYNKLLLLSCVQKEQILLLFIGTDPNVGNVVDSSCKFSKITSRVISGILSFYMFSISLTPATSTLCIMIFQIWCHSYVKLIPHWLPIIPQFQNYFFNFMPRNVNSSAKKNFQRVRWKLTIAFLTTTWFLFVKLT